MTEDEQLVFDAVRSAFDGVKLGHGVGLLYGQGLDEYADDSTLERYRTMDEAEDWSRLEIDQLNGYFGSLSYMDEEGMRFHLPAYMIADLQGGLSQDLLFHLCYMSSTAQSRFDLLNANQRASVRQFLQLRLNDPKYSFQSSMIKESLEEYWRR